MTRFRVSRVLGDPIEITSDDMIIFDNMREDQFCFMLHGVPKLIIPMSNVACIEQIDTGDWTGDKFQLMSDVDHERF